MQGTFKQDLKIVSDDGTSTTQGTIILQFEGDTDKLKNFKSAVATCAKLTATFLNEEKEG